MRELMDHTIGVGQKPILEKNLTVENLTSSNVDTDDNVLREHTQDAGQRPGSENGISHTVELIVSHTIN